jgi:hypothetical protein
MDMITDNLFRPRALGGAKNIGISESGVQPIGDDGNPALTHFMGIYEIYLELVSNEDVECYKLKDFLKPRYLQELF